MTKKAYIAVIFLAFAVIALAAANDRTLCASLQGSLFEMVQQTAGPPLGFDYGDDDDDYADDDRLDIMDTSVDFFVNELMAQGDGDDEEEGVGGRDLDEIIESCRQYRQEECSAILNVDDEDPGSKKEGLFVWKLCDHHFIQYWRE